MYSRTFGESSFVPSVADLVSATLDVVFYLSFIGLLVLLLKITKMDYYLLGAYEWELGIKKFLPMMSSKSYHYQVSTDLLICHRIDKFLTVSRGKPIYLV